MELILENGDRIEFSQDGNKIHLQGIGYFEMESRGMFGVYMDCHPEVRDEILEYFTDNHENFWD